MPRKLIAHIPVLSVLLLLMHTVVAFGQEQPKRPGHELKQADRSRPNRKPRQLASPEASEPLKEGDSRLVSSRVIDEDAPLELDTLPKSMPLWEPLSLDDVGRGFEEPSKEGETPTTDNAPLKLSKEGAAENEDKMEDIQSFNTYTSLEDGQPGQRGELQINYFNGWQTQSHTSDPWLMVMEVEYSPKCKGNWFLENAKFGINVPLELGNGGVDGNGDINLLWKQRLVEEQAGNWWPTFTIENEVRLPTGDNSSGVDWTLQGVVAKEVGPGTAVFNAFLKSANGHNNLERASWWDRSCGDVEDDDLRHFQWGFRTGYKWRLTNSFALVTDYVNQCSELNGNRNQNIGEVAAEWRVNSHLTVGPGIMFGLDGQEETPRFGAGVLVHYSWGD